MEIPGNKLVDSFTKEAVLGTSSPTENLPDILRKPLTYSAAALRQEYTTATETYNQELWLVSRRAPKHSKLDPDASSPKFRKMMADHQRKELSIITQLRTGHIPLAVYLHRI